MANQLNEANVLSIKSLHQQGWSQRRIARELGLNRETVAKYVHELSKPANLGPAPSGPGDSNPATERKAPTGSKPAAADSKPATLDKAPTGSRSLCEP